MSTVVNKATLERRDSVNTPDYDTSLWLINPDHLDAPKHHVRVNDAGDNLELLPGSEMCSRSQEAEDEDEDKMEATRCDW